MLITLDVESMDTNIYHTKGLQVVRDVIGNDPVYDQFMETFELGLKKNDIYLMMNGSSKK